MDAYHPRIAVTPSDPARENRTFGFFLLAWTLTWLLAFPTALAWMRHATPPPYALVGAGLSAFGPLLAALFFSRIWGKRGVFFERFWASPVLVVGSLLTPMAIHVVATVLYSVCGGQPSAWLHPPSTPEQLAALVVFPLGEEFGWRGFAHPRLAARYGLVRGSLLLGLGWGVWHLMYSVTPQAAGFDAIAFVLAVVELPLYSLLVAWVFERARRGMAVAIAFHAGAHLDHIELAPRAELGLQIAHVIVLAIVAIFAARALAAADARHLQVAT